MLLSSNKLILGNFTNVCDLAGTAVEGTNAEATSLWVEDDSCSMERLGSQGSSIANQSSNRGKFNYLYLKIDSMAQQNSRLIAFLPNFILLYFFLDFGSTFIIPTSKFLSQWFICKFSTVVHSITHTNALIWERYVLLHE